MSRSRKGVEGGGRRQEWFQHSDHVSIDYKLLTLSQRHWYKLDVKKL